YTSSDVYNQDKWSQATTTASDLRTFLNTTLTSTNSGDIVYIQNGDYKLSGTISLSKTLHLYGGFTGEETTSSDRKLSTQTTTLNANGSSYVIFITTNSTLNGFTITGGQYSSGVGGVYIDGCSPTITNCTITGNTDNSTNSGGGGISIHGNSAPQIINCTIVNNHTSHQNGGHEIYLADNGNPTPTVNLKNTLIWNNDDYSNAIKIGGIGGNCTISYDHCAYPNASGADNIPLSDITLVSSDNGLYLAKNNVALRNTSIIFGGVKDNTTPLFDQRGKRRGNPLSSSAMSIGAIEFYPVFSIDITGGTEINTTYGTSKTLTFNTVASLDNEPMADYDNLNLTREYNVTWSVESDVSTISISDGVLTVGNTTPAGTYTVTVKAQANATLYNTGITSNTASKVVTVTVAKGNITLNLTKAKDLPGGTVDTAYSSVKLSEYFTATSTLNTAAIAWSISGTLPDGLTCTDGTISGTPTKAGTFNFNVVATATAENYNDVSKDITASITIVEKTSDPAPTPATPIPADPTPESAEPTPVPVNPTPVSNEPTHGQKVIVDTITIPESGIDGLTSEDKANVKTL
ncbi:MAG: putative Ig domain-containing protein, partial [Synergistaceae bacterium]|nr:putative Ig domain-containing protein [Synergistaceae bacterium]